MDSLFVYQGTTFTWDGEKARRNQEKHGVLFEAAATVFFDPFIRIIDTQSENESKDAAIGFDSLARLLFVVHLVQADDQIRIISARRATPTEEKFYVE